MRSTPRLASERGSDASRFPARDDRGVMIDARPSTLQGPELVRALAAGGVGAAIIASVGLRPDGSV